MRLTSRYPVQKGHVKLLPTVKIALEIKLAVFTVMGMTEPYVVRLFPKTSCSCPAKSNCYCVNAVEEAVGYCEPSRRQLNLTQLRINKRKRAHKTLCWKHPRIDDVSK